MTMSESNTVKKGNAEIGLQNNSKLLRKRLLDENKFIAGVLEFTVFPKVDSDSEEDDEAITNGHANRSEKNLQTGGGTGRAMSVTELHERLQKKLDELRGTAKSGKEGKRKLSKAEKKQKAKDEKRLKAKITKKGKDFGSKMAQAAVRGGAKPVKPVYNSEGKMVFSKFDFTDDQGFRVCDTDQKKPKLDPKAALAKLQKHKEKISSLEGQGKSEKAQAIEESTAWKTALDRASGVKVKDNATLLKKSIKKLERKKKVSKKNWEQRQEQEENRKDQKQKKRAENIGKRKADKSKKKGKKAVPGFR